VLTNLSSKPIPPQIERTAQNVATQLRPQRVILFGSYAYGVPHELSDIDLLIVTHKIPQRKDRYQLTRAIARDAQIEVPLQLVFMRPDEFDETKDVIGGIAYPAHHWGKVLYAENA
jgi:uncharacterized protein